MKTVGVLTPTFTTEYMIDILSGISDYFRDKDIQVVIAQTKIPGLLQGAFDYQYCSGIDYLKAKDVDAIIVASGVYCASMNQNDFISILKEFGNRPIISIGTNLKLKNSYTITSDCKKVYASLVKHLKESHRCQNIAFFSANSTKSEDAILRYEAFKSAMSANKLPLKEEWVFDGIFTDFRAYEEIKKRYNKKEDVPFDAVVCANDMMASGCLKALQEIGVRVPEDVKIVGFDDSVVATTSRPKLSSVSQDIYSQGFEAAELAYRILNNEKQSKTILNPLLLKLRQSCGCIDCKTSLNIYKDVYGDTNDENAGAFENPYKFSNEMAEKNNIITLMDMASASNTLKQLFYNLRYITDQCDFCGIAVHFFNEIQFLDSEEEFKIPDVVELCMLVDRENNLELFHPEVTFNPNEMLVSSRSLQGQNGIYILNPIFSGETNYGYLLCKIKANKFADYNVYLKIVNSALAQAYEYTSKLQETQKLVSENSVLTRQSRTDELTGILNRRGFIENGQEALDMLQETDTAGVIFFLDMDNLKKINDTYGHEMGDRAIKAQAKALKSVFRSTDVVGRLSGDEFGVVAVGMKLPYLENIRLKLDMMNKKVSQEEGLPFEISISMGAVDLQGSAVLKKLLTEADKKLYEEKKLKHAKKQSRRSK